jgi:ascorbate-specific PTS system EIIC-type component UlaA
MSNCDRGFIGKAHIKRFATLRARNSAHANCDTLNYTKKWKMFEETASAGSEMLALLFVIIIVFISVSGHFSVSSVKRRRF